MCVCDMRLRVPILLFISFYSVFMFRDASHSIFGSSHLHAYSLAPLAKVI